MIFCTEIEFYLFFLDKYEIIDEESFCFSLNIMRKLIKIWIFLHFNTYFKFFILQPNIFLEKITQLKKYSQ